MAEQSRGREARRGEDSGYGKQQKSFLGRDGFNLNFEGMNYEEPRVPYHFIKKGDRKEKDDLKRG